MHKYIYSKDCTGDKVLLIYDVCYHFFEMSERVSVDEMGEKCLSEGLTIADFPTFEKPFLLNYLIYLFDETKVKLF